jgi:hypothetical protein
MAASKKKDDAEKTVPDIVADPTLSVDAQFSTYKVNTDLPEPEKGTAPLGRHVIQELGHPSES